MNPQNTGFKLVVAAIATVITYPLFSFIGSGEFIGFGQLGANLSFRLSRPETQAGFTVEPIKPEGIKFKVTEELDTSVLEANLSILGKRQSRDPTKLEDPEHNYEMAWVLYKLVKKTAPTDDETSRASYIANAYTVATKAHDLYAGKGDERGRKKALGLMSSIEALASTYDVSLPKTGSSEKQEEEVDWGAVVRAALEANNRKVEAEIETKQARLDELYAMIEANPTKAEDADHVYEIAWLHYMLSKNTDDTANARKVARKALDLALAKGDEQGVKKAEVLIAEIDILHDIYQ